jgi:hypothetical protein
MVPQEYRLEQVSAALVERLDAARRSWADRAAADADAARVAGELLAAVTAESASWSALSDPEAHGAFLRREIERNVLPRAVDLMHAHTEAERRGHAMGRWSSPLGRVALVLGSLAFVGLVLIRFERYAIDWVLTALTLAVPFLPDVVARVADRRYAASISTLLEDTRRIQDQAARYAPLDLDVLPAGPSDVARRAARVAAATAPRTRDTQGTHG